MGCDGEHEFPTRFSGEYPSTDEARAVALKNFKPTKQDREEAWIVNNATNPQKRLRMRQLAECLNELGINLPIVLASSLQSMQLFPHGLTSEIVVASSELSNDITN